MNVFNKYFIILLVGVLTLPTLYAQNGGLRVFDLPLKYLLMDEHSNTNITNEYVYGRVWIVYSDRIGNNTYTSPKNRGDIMESSIEFLESFYVIDEIEGYLHIVKDENLSVNLTLSKTSKDFGWISMDNLLLTSHCLTTYPNKNNQIVIPISINTNSIQESDLLFNNIYIDPSLVNHNPTSITQGDMVLYFVYKESNNSLLVGKSYYIRDEEASEIILGWIRRSDITFWNNQLALEVNWDKQAVESRLKLNINPRIFLTRSEAVGFSKGKDKKRGFWENNDKETRDYRRGSGKFNRYPIIEELNGICKVVYFDVENPRSVSARYGYAPLNFKYINQPLFEKVVLLSRGDLGDLTSSIKKLARAKGNQRRQRMKDTWIELLQEKIGEIDVEEMMDKGMSEINKILFDVPSQSEFLNNIRLRDITDPRMLSNHEFEQLIFEFQRKQTKLSNIFNNDDYEEQFRSLGIPYYWIPEYLMP